MLSVESRLSKPLGLFMPSAAEYAEGVLGFPMLRYIPALRIYLSMGVRQLPDARATVVTVNRRDSRKVERLGTKVHFESACRHCIISPALGAIALFRAGAMCTLPNIRILCAYGLYNLYHKTV
jgi:hypothetical protein